MIGVRGHRGGIPGVCGWVGGLIANGALKEESWKFPKLSKRPGCQAQVTGHQLRLLEQSERGLCASFCSGGSQAGRQMARVQAPARPVARPRPPWVFSSVSLSQLTLGLSVRRCITACHPNTRGSAQGSTTSISLCLHFAGAAPHPDAPGCKAWSQAFQP